MLRSLKLVSPAEEAPRAELNAYLKLAFDHLSSMAESL